MNKSVTIKQQLIAACLLLAFLFITGVKLFHSHETITVASKSSGIEKVLKATDCPICDYQLAKDTHHFDSFPLIEKMELRLSSYSLYNTPFVTSIGATSSGRGPPALV